MKISGLKNAFFAFSSISAEYLQQI